MKTIVILTVATALILAGCAKPKGPQTTEISATAPLRPMESLTPEPLPPPGQLGPGTDVITGDDVPEPEPVPMARAHTIIKGDTLWSLRV
ncbi:hypothetical protein LCGC14_2789270, partial [marine sediment metagenome]